MFLPESDDDKGKEALPTLALVEALQEALVTLDNLKLDLAAIHVNAAIEALLAAGSDPSI